MSTTWAFDHIKNKHTLYSGKHCTKKFCGSLEEQAKNIIDLEKKKMLPLKKKQIKMQKDVIFAKKESLKSSLKA